MPARVLERSLQSAAGG